MDIVGDKELKEILRNYFFLSLFITSEGKFSLISILKVLIMGSILPAFVILGSYIDNTFCLPGNGRGLFQHYGIWALFITAPIFIIITLTILKRFILIIRNIKSYLTCNRIPVELIKLINKEIQSISLKSKSKYLLLLLGIIGFFFSIVNIYQTVEPMKYYGNDVFDEYRYFSGFFLNKVFLIFIWTIIYPIFGFIVLHVSYSMIKIFKYLYNKKILFLDFFHKDNCGGVSNFGFINNLILVIYLNIFFVFFCLFITHSYHYLTLIASSILLTGIMIVHNFLIVYYIQKFVKSEKERRLKEINELLNKKIKNLKSFQHDLLALRSHIIAIRSHPYTKLSFLIKIFLRYFPPAITLMKVLLSR